MNWTDALTAFFYVASRDYDISGADFADVVRKHVAKAQGRTLIFSDEERRQWSAELATEFVRVVNGGGQSVRDSNWIMTASGKKVDPFAPDPSQITIEDIAHALAAINRFNGHTRIPLSVAQHSVLIARILPPEYARFALLHDATEIYLSDVPRPVKRHESFAAYREIEARLEATIYRRFDIVPEPDGIVALALADRRMLRTEQRDLMPPAADGEDRSDVEPYPDEIRPWAAWGAKRAFLQTWKDSR